MKQRMLTGVVLTLAASVVLLAGEPGEKAKGPEFKTEDFTLVWGKLKTSADVNFGDAKKSKYSLELEGSMEVPTTLDVVAVVARFRLRSATDDKGANVSIKPAAVGQIKYNAIHGQVGQVELPKTDLPLDATRIGTIVLDADIVIAGERDYATLPAVVMEDFKDLGHGVSIRITSLQMSADRELSVTLSYKRAAANTSSPFMEQVYAVAPDGQDLGGGRWTEGDPFGKTGTYTAKFKLAGKQTHQSFRFQLVTKSESRKVSFEVSNIFVR